MASIPGWVCTKPGINTLDELHRALRDIQRLTEIWARIAKENADAWDEPRDERQRLQAELESHARQNWTDWTKAVDRVYRAIAKADIAQIGFSKPDVLKPIGILNRLFPHSILGESDGAHLLQGMHPLGSDRHGTSYFPETEAIEAFKPINEIVDVLILAAPRHTDADRKTCDPQPDEMRSASWFTIATSGLLSGDVLRKAVGRSSLSKSTQSERGKEWSHSIEEVCRKYPHYAAKIMAAYSKDQI